MIIKSTFKGDGGMHTSLFLGPFIKSVKWHFKIHFFLLVFILCMSWVFKIVKLWLDTSCASTAHPTPPPRLSPSVYPQHLECCQQQLLIKPGVLDSSMVYFCKHDHFQQFSWNSLIIPHITWKVIVINFPCTLSMYKCLSLYCKRTCVNSSCH